MGALTGTTKGEINNGSFDAKPCQQRVGVIQKVCSSFSAILYTHDQYVWASFVCFFLFLFFSFLWPGGQVMSFVRTKENTETFIERVGG